MVGVIKRYLIAQGQLLQSVAIMMLFIWIVSIFQEQRDFIEVAVLASTFFLGVGQVVITLTYGARFVMAIFKKPEVEDTLTPGINLRPLLTVRDLWHMLLGVLLIAADIVLLLYYLSR